MPPSQLSHYNLPLPSRGVVSPHLRQLKLRRQPSRSTPSSTTANPRDFLAAISASAKSHHTVILGYRKKTDHEKFEVLEVEPYAFKVKSSGQGYLYAYCLKHGVIHSLLWDRIVSVRGTNRTFTPRWPVEF